MAEILGLDLGTTNTLVAVRYPGESAAQPFLEHGRPHPSVVKYHGGSTVVGRAARDELESPEVGVIGSIVRSPKRFLGGPDIAVGGVAKDPSEIVADILRHVREHAEGELGGRMPFGNVVATIPVNMDGRGRQALRRAAQLAGFDIHQFVHEPLAALYGHLRQGGNSGRRIAELDGRMVLVFDWGGGTLDITLCRVDRGTLVQIHNEGTAQVGGDEFDDRLMHHVAERHRLRHGLGRGVAPVPGAKAQLNVAVEQAKIRLSRRSSAQILVPYYLTEDGPAQTLEDELTLDDLREVTQDLVDEGLSAIDDLLRYVGVAPEAIALCLATGGMVAMPAIRAGLIERFGGPARVPEVPGGDRIIAEGAAWIAADGQPLRLAKPFEVLHADDTYLPLLDAQTLLPTIGTSLATTFDMYCVDPSDGFARFLFGRPSLPNRSSSVDRRDPYGVAVIGVDPTAAPLLERLRLSIAVDEDLIVHVDIRSSLAQDQRVLDLHQLEFGLALGAG